MAFKTLKYRFLIVLLLTPLLSHAQRLHFRTDGYYFYDNKCDTIYLAKYEGEIKEMLSKAGFGTKGAEPCVPRNTVSLDGSSNLEFIGFSSDQAGTRSTSNCAYLEKVQECIKKIATNYAGADTMTIASNAITNIRINKDNTFTANVGKGQHTFRKLSGQIFPDRLEVRFIYPPMFEMYDANKLKIFRFYKFNELPPLRNKIYYKYKPVPRG